MKSLNKKPSIHTKVGRYFMAVRKGETKKEAQLIAGYRGENHNVQIEKTKEFQALTTYFKDDLIQQISVHEINEALVDNIKQTGETKIDRNARNKAIEISKEIIEPKNSPPSDAGDRVLIVLSSGK